MKSLPKSSAVAPFIRLSLLRRRANERGQQQRVGTSLDAEQLKLVGGGAKLPVSKW